MSKNELNVDLEFCDKTWELRLEVAEYANGRTAIQAYCRNDGDCFGRITVNIPEAEQAEGEIFVKTWSENYGWVPQLPILMPHVFRNTGKKVPARYTHAEVWEFTPDAEPVSE